MKSLRPGAGLDESGMGTSIYNGKNDSTAWMDSDDICHPERFEKQVYFLKTNRHIDVLDTNIREFSSTINDLNPPESHDRIFRLSKVRCPVIHVTVFAGKVRL